MITTARITTLCSSMINVCVLMLNLDVCVSVCTMSVGMDLLDWTVMDWIGLELTVWTGLGGINSVEFNLLSITLYLTVPMKTGSATVTVPGQSKSPCPKSSPSLEQLTIKPNHSRVPTFSHHTRPFPFIQAPQHKN